MSKPSVAVFGASGLVGSALCERMYFEYGPCFRAFIHTFANAARIARFPIEIQRVDLQDYKSVRSAVEDCECVVNCVLGDRRAMLGGLRHLIRAAKETRIKKFIHLGSIAIYGEDPAPDCESEDAAPTPTNEYGRMKRRQDELIFALHRAGVPSIILCPGHITGPYATFIDGAIEALSAGEFFLVDAGRHPTNHIHVENLVEAILTAMRAKDGWGERYFVTELERPTWARLYTDLRDILGLEYAFAEVTRDEVLRQMRKPGYRPLAGTMEALRSRELRSALYAIPAIGTMREMARKSFHFLGPELQWRIKSKMKSGARIPLGPAPPDLNQRFITVQVRRPYFAPVKIQKRLGYAPILNYTEGMETIRSWYRFAAGG